MPTRLKRIPLGTIVYDTRGRKGRLMAYGDAGPLVCVIMNVETGDGLEEYDGDIEPWPELFRKTPTAVLDERVAGLSKEIQELSAKKLALLAEERQAQADITARRARITQHAQLKLLDDYIAGKITHYVQTSQYQSVLSIIAVKDCKNDYSNSLKLLTLYGKANGDLSWRLSHYADGSGRNDQEVYPVCSLQEAMIKARAIFDERITLWRAGKVDHYLKPFTDSARVLGFDTPQDVLDHLTRIWTQHAREKVASAEKALKLATDELNRVSIPHDPRYP